MNLSFRLTPVLPSLLALLFLVTPALGQESREYRSSTMLGDAIIQVDPETRSLVVITDDETNLEIGKIIENIDRPKPQVLIRVLFLEVTHNDSLDIGIEGDLVISSDGDIGPFETALSFSQLDGGFVRLIGNNWEATFKALARRGKLEVLSRPSILARNNQEAVIVVGEEVPFITNSRITEFGQTINTIQYDDIGIILRVTPFITSEGFVEMIVAPEISTLTDRTVPISDNVNAPIIAKRSAETVVVTPDATTVVIGGLMETQRTESVTRIPLLGDIPVLGFPFRRTTKDEVKKELLIFLTPYIITGAEKLRDLTLDEANRTQLMPQAIPPHEFERYADTLTMEPALPPLPVPEVDDEEQIVPQESTIPERPGRSRGFRR